MSVSIIIPTLNERASIDALQSQLDALEGKADVLFSDGGSTDGTYERIRYPKIQRAHYRGAQMNAAAREAHGEYLWFLHADSRFSADSLQAIEESGFDVGCFRVQFDSASVLLKLAAFWASNWRVRVRHIAFGDQGIFVKRSLFFEVGAYRDIPLMEDYQFSLDMRAAGHPVQLLDAPLVTSARRFKRGAVSTLLQMKHLQFQYRRGVDVALLHKSYESHDGKDDGSLDRDHKNAANVH